MATAKRIVLGCDMVDGKTAEQIGLVQWSVPEPRALIILRRACGANIAEFGGSACRQQTLPGQDRSSIDRGLDAEVQETLHLLETADPQFRVKAFLEGRRAR